MARRGPDKGDVESLLERAADQFDRGDLDAALKQIDEAVSHDPSSVAALHWRAIVLAEMDRSEEAHLAFEAAHEAAGDDLDVIVDAADFYLARALDQEHDSDWLERGVELARRGRRIARRRGDDDAEAECARIEGTGLSQLGRPDEALPSLDLAARIHPDDPAVLAERGFALYELSRFEDARNQLLEVVRRVPEDAWAHHTLGLVAEREGDEREAGRWFEKAREIAPEDFPRPVELSPKAFDSAVEEALKSLPEHVRKYLSNVAIAVEDLPSTDDLLASSPPLSPSILGVFRGAPLGEKASMNPWSHFPSSIVVYQRNLQRYAHDREELIEEIGITLLHEVGHFLGLDEQDLWERGLD